MDQRLANVVVAVTGKRPGESIQRVYVLNLGGEALVVQDLHNLPSDQRRLPLILSPDDDRGCVVAEADRSAFGESRGIGAVQVHAY